MLPPSLRAVHALNAATFQASSLALLSIVNSRAGVPAEYLPAYGAVAFLPFSLRPIIAWASSRLLSLLGDERGRHDRLLFPAFLLECAAMAGTTLVPAGGIVPCFALGFGRGVAGAWSDFLLGMTVIELSRLQRRVNPGGGASYEEVVSVNTAQSTTAKNVGSFVASVGAFLFLAQSESLSEEVANAMLMGTAGIFLLAGLASLMYRRLMGRLAANSQSYDAIDDCDEGTAAADVMEASEAAVDGDEASSSSVDGFSENDVSSGDNSLERKGTQLQQIMEILTLVTFQMLLAASALHKPIVALSSQTVWISAMAITAVLLVSAICFGYSLEQKNTTANPVLQENGRLASPGCRRLSHRRLNLYFLLRYAMPIASFLIYSYQFAVFEDEPGFLQLLSVAKAAVGGLSALFYERFLSPHCHSGWPLIGLIASLDIIVGLVSLLDVWVVHAVRQREVSGEYTIDNSLRFLVAGCALTKYFFAELDYMPALVLTTINVCDDHVSPVRSEENSHSDCSNEIGECGEVTRAKLDGLDIPKRSSLEVDLSDDGSNAVHEQFSVQNAPAISAGMQYASFLSCIDFGAQIGDWISVPIIAALGVARENHWEHLDQFIVLCSICRIARVTFLCLICPPISLRRTV